MNIKEVAQLAGVSTSTVSKIINGKDEAISSETREKVLSIVKGCGYVQYSGVKSAPVRTFLIGLLLNGGCLDGALLSGVITAAAKNGYQTVVSFYSSDEEEVMQAAALCGKDIDGVLWERRSLSSEARVHYFKDAGIPVCTCDCFPAGAGGLPYAQLAGAAAELILAQGHRRLACLVSPEDSPRRREFCEGYRQALFERQAPFEERFVCAWEENSQLSVLLSSGVTGVICSDEAVAADVYRQARLNRISIPEDLSVAALADEKGKLGMIPPLTAVEKPSRALGEGLCLSLIERIEKKDGKQAFSPPVPRIRAGKSVACPPGERRPKIVVVGSINMDTIIGLNRIPNVGETLASPFWSQSPGGKGANQAVAAGRLGANVTLIGRVGKDHDAVQLFHSLTSSGVHLQGVKSDAEYATGKAYIYVQEDGESSIVVYVGANGNLSMQDIRDGEEAFQGAAFCLLQLETPEPLATYVAGVAARCGARVILKPSVATSIGDELLGYTSILLPNERELHTLVPGDAPVEEKASMFLEHGAGCVVVTLGHRGCCLCTREGCAWYPALACKPVDTTGAADAFAASLAVFLAEGEEMDSAICGATVAAGLSTMKIGVQPALVDRGTLDAHRQEIRDIQRRVRRCQRHEKEAVGQGRG